MFGRRPRNAPQMWAPTGEGDTSMPTRADPRPPSSGGSHPALSSTAQGGQRLWRGVAPQVSGEAFRTSRT
eukprot:1185733-Prymnesium_polylepis.1